MGIMAFKKESPKYLVTYTEPTIRSAGVIVLIFNVNTLILARHFILSRHGGAGLAGRNGRWL